MANRVRGMLGVIGLMTVSLSGCMSLGPHRISPDRVDYIQEVSESWKKQMLLNIVKLRYFDPPTFLDVSSIINQYGIENQVNADARWYWPFNTSNYAGFGGYSRYSDKPTITYTPLSGQKFTKNLLTPIPPHAVVSLIQNGWPIDVIFTLTVKAVNGVRNGSVGRVSNNGQEDFNQLVQAFRTIQNAGVTDIRLAKVDDKEIIVYVITDDASKELYRTEIQDVRRILKVKPEQNSYNIVFGAIATSDNEIALLTRSMLEIMLEMGTMVEVPAEHVASKRVNDTIAYTGPARMRTKIYSGREKPKDAFTAIHYQGYWFWVDNNDISSKRNFALLMIFLSLTETEQKSGAGPLLSL